VLGAFAVGCAVLFTASSTSAPAASSSIPIKGGGSWGAYRELLTWQNDLSEAKQPLDLSYTAHGSLIGRQEFLSGTNDFVLSGVPFTPDELTKVPGGAAGIIDAPVQVSTLGFLLEAPVPDGFSTLQQLCDPDDPNTPDPSQCLVKHAYTGPIKLPVTNLAAMLLRYTGTTFPPLNSWNATDVLKTMGVDNFTTPPLAGPAPVNRSDPDEVNYFLQQYVATKAPAVWNAVEVANPTIPWDPITERLGRPGSSRDGVDQQSQQLALGGGDPTTGTINQFTAGVFAPVPPSALGGIKKTFPDVKLQFIQVQNANGDWVEPTPESINAAVDAGGVTPLYALNNKVPGAYPLVWVDHLYAPAHGLSIEKTEAMAAMIRYLATAGQSAGKPVGEGRLSAPLTAQALNAANQLVSSNCTGNDRHVEQSTDPGPDLPNLPAVKTIGMMQHCVTGAPPATGSSDGFAGQSGTFDSTGTSSGSSSGTVAASASSTATAAGGAAADVKVRRRADGSLIATNLPLPAPSTMGGVDRFATLLLGVGLYFLLRKPVRKLLARRAT
jgi:ABC-type phosphate transport system substrate-binding protein